MTQGPNFSLMNRGPAESAVIYVYVILYCAVLYTMI